ncbi:MULTISPECIES: AAA family ATPase [Spirulina sp. CCY15215]|uniref:trifunctional serine/threonine-protein kinase/ATP-binding protein/sensor histidine kinase n=1 Tax=Spirulina sp. CCY15215 TaxID=2767591 RepID=UPI001EF18210|nr:AAA family ATPase [Spirulina major]
MYEVINDVQMMETEIVRFFHYQTKELIHESDRTLVYRGQCNDDAKPVILKLMRNEYPSFHELVQFRNQYAITRNLNIEGIIKTYALERYENRHVMIMEDFGGMALQEAKEDNYTVVEFLAIAIQLAEILHQLHQNRLIHKDIKPANILIHPQTQQVKLIDFSISSLLPKETQTLQTPNVLEGTLAYLSPEQTGRMNRGVDYRSDFYSLGVTFYQLLTGKLPFVSDDPLELIHAHIAKTPPLISHQLSIPKPIADIVMKLMAKNAEDRYQSALGLKYDLEKCQKQWQESEKIEPFVLGERDRSDRFLIPEKLYGREKEVQMLLEVFDRVSEGKTEIMLVAGFSGIGKTAVVNEVHKPIVAKRGYFIKGKFDQFQRNIPFSAFVQAFRDLMGQLLGESDTQLALWKSKILKALGENGQIVIDVIPELERIIGEQPAVAELSGSAAQNRFNRLFSLFIQVFTTRNHPLVIFIDDLQWADSASLKLMQLLMEDAEIGYLLLLGAYRDNEVFPAHPLMLTLDNISKAEVILDTITLAPLSKTNLNDLVADTLSCEEEIALPLTELVYQKTQGNPFFATQFLKGLHDDGWIHFNFNVGYWQCDLTRVQELTLSDDVVEFMATRLHKLEGETQEILKLAACIGNQFDLETLAMVCDRQGVEVATALWPALKEGLILPLSYTYKFFQETHSEEQAQPKNISIGYKFLHDRVQQAAYSLIPDSDKKATHLKIGQLLQQNYSEIKQEEKLFDIVEHLNQGQELIAHPQERENLAKLNLKAGVKARNSTAYTAAKIYLQIGIELLTESCWLHQYELTLNLYVAAAEVAYLNADLDKMEQMAALVLAEAQTILDKIKIYKIQIVALTAQSKMLEAIAVARDALGQLGVELPTAPDETKIGKALQNLANLQSGRGIQELIDLPVMSDRQTQAAMQLLGMLFATVFQGMPGLMPILSATMVSLSLQFGNTPASTVGYAIHGLVLCNFLGEVETGYNFGQLALKLLNRFNVGEFKPTVLLFFGACIQHHQESLRAMMVTLKSGYVAGMEIGDFLNAGYCMGNYFNATLFAGVELDTWKLEIAAYRAVLVQVKQYSALTYVDMAHQVVRNLKETRTRQDCLIGDIYDETVMIPKHHQDNDLTSIAIAYIYKLMLAYCFGNYTVALNHNAEAKQYLMGVSGMIFVPIFHFYAALTHLALFSTQPEPEQAELLALVEADQTTLKQWAQNAPMNHLHKWYLVEAERQRVLGNKSEAIDLYDRAISLAQENQFLNEEALANELAAKFYLDWGKEKVASGYMQDAYYCYARWGAKAKIEDLETRYPSFLTPILAGQKPSLTGSTTFVSLSTGTISKTTTGAGELLDLATLMKASRLLSEEIELEGAIANLMKVIRENAGAETVALMLFQEQVLTLKARSTGEDNCTDSIPVESSNVVPLSIINQVKNRRKPLLLTNVSQEASYAGDVYIQQHQPKSVLCLPLIDRGQLIGILYLENNRATGAFTGDRAEILNLLCSQAAIALENAQLYQQAQQAVTNLQQAQLQLVQKEKMATLGNLVAGVAHEINNPLGFIGGNVTVIEDYLKDLFTIIQGYREEFPNPSPQLTEDIEELDLDFLLEDFPKTIASMQEGVNRIRDISTSLRTFSRTDTDKKTEFNLHEGIDSTLLILKYRLKANEKRPAIEIIKEYGDVPEIKCHAGQLNQVFMNLLANAIDALEESSAEKTYTEIESDPNCITVSTQLSEDKQSIIVKIADNGMGISDEIKERIFEQGFTTKEVGKGTGLGMAIARQIITEKHCGTIQVNSILGKGTEFMITLPN